MADFYTKLSEAAQLLTQMPAAEEVNILQASFFFLQTTLTHTLKRTVTVTYMITADIPTESSIAVEFTASLEGLASSAFQEHFEKLRSLLKSDAADAKLNPVWDFVEYLNEASQSLGPITTDNVVMLVDEENVKLEHASELTEANGGNVDTFLNEREDLKGTLEESHIESGIDNLNSTVGKQDVLKTGTISVIQSQASTDPSHQRLYCEESFKGEHKIISPNIEVSEDRGETTKEENTTGIRFHCFYCNDIAMMVANNSDFTPVDSFQNQVLLRDHICSAHGQHEGDKLCLACPVCGLVYSVQHQDCHRRQMTIRLVKHMQEKHNVILQSGSATSYTCMFCPITPEMCEFESRVSLRRHIQASHIGAMPTKRGQSKCGLKCPSCDIAYTSVMGVINTKTVVNRLLKHWEEKHKDEGKNENILTGSKDMVKSGNTGRSLGVEIEKSASHLDTPGGPWSETDGQSIMNRTQHEQQDVGNGLISDSADGSSTEALSKVALDALVKEEILHMEIIGTEASAPVQHQDTKSLPCKRKKPPKVVTGIKKQKMRPMVLMSKVDISAYSQSKYKSVITSSIPKSPPQRGRLGKASKAKGENAMWKLDEEFTVVSGIPWRCLLCPHTGNQVMESYAALTEHITAYHLGSIPCPQSHVECPLCSWKSEGIGQEHADDMVAVYSFIQHSIFSHDMLAPASEDSLKDVNRAQDEASGESLSSKKTELMHTCSLCLKQFKLELNEQFTKHIFDDHMTLASENKFTMSCPSESCDYSISRKGSFLSEHDTCLLTANEQMLVHQIHHHRMAVPKAINIFHCDICGLETLEQAKHQQHMLLAHVRWQRRNNLIDVVPWAMKVACVACNKKVRGSDLAEHHSGCPALIHEDDRKRNFSCDICPKAFVHPRTLMKHRQTVHKDYIGQKCEEGESGISSDAIHLPSHVEKSFVTTKKSVVPADVPVAHPSQDMQDDVLAQVGDKHREITVVNASDYFDLSEHLGSVDHNYVAIEPSKTFDVSQSLVNDTQLERLPENSQTLNPSSARNKGAVAKQNVYTCIYCTTKNSPDTCSQGYKYEKHLKKHIVNEHVALIDGRKYFVCPICSQQIQMRTKSPVSRLFTHLELVHALRYDEVTTEYGPATVIKEEQPRKSTVTEENEADIDLEVTRSIPIITCPLCDESSISYPVATSLIDHMVTAHLSDVNPLQSFVLKCQLCTWETNGVGDILSSRKVAAYNFWQHYIILHDFGRTEMGQRSAHSESVDTAATVDATVKASPCILCDEEIDYKNETSLRDHVASRHITKLEESVSQLQCSICDFHILRKSGFMQQEVFVAVLWELMLSHMVYQHSVSLPNTAQVYTCGICSLQTLKRSCHQIHTFYAHKKWRKLHSPQVRNSLRGKRVACACCTKDIRVTDMKQHQGCCPALVHQGQRMRNFQCDQCPKSYLHEKDLNYHFKKDHDPDTPVQEKKTNVCTECGLLFGRPGKLQIHMWRAHQMASEADSMGLCHQCGMNLPTKLMPSHVKQTHNMEPEVCETCGKTCEGKGALKKHMLEHKIPTKCALCDYVIPVGRAKSYMRLHMARVHNVNRFQCDVCHYFVASNENALRRHKERYHSGAVGRINYCNICERQLQGKTAYHNHMFVKHQVNLTSRPVCRCDICDFETLGEVLLKDHLKCHREPKYQCRICGKKLKTMSLLKTHIRLSHQRSGQHQCPICTFESSNAHGLSKHVASVHEKKRITCERCPYRTFSESLYKNHLKLKHGIGLDKEQRLLSLLMKEKPKELVEGNELLVKHISVPGATPESGETNVTVIANIGTGDTIEADTGIPHITLDEHRMPVADVEYQEEREIELPGVGSEAVILEPVTGSDEYMLYIPESQAFAGMDSSTVIIETVTESDI